MELRVMEKGFLELLIQRKTKNFALQNYTR